MKKELYIPLIIFSLTLIYLILSAVASLTNNKPFLLKYKMKIATLIIAFNSMVYGAKGQYNEDVSCYLVPTKSSTPFFLGVNANINNSFSNDIPNPSTTINNLMKSKERTGTGGSLGFSFEYRIGVESHSQSSILLDLDYNYYKGSLDESLSSVASQGSVRYKEEFSNSTISLDALYRLYPIPDVGFYISGGVQFDYIFSNNLSQKITSNNGFTLQDSTPIVRYEDNGNTIILYDDKAKSLNHFQFSIKTELGYDLNFTGFYITPSVGYDYNITKMTSNSDWRISDLYFGMRIVFAIK